MTIAMQTETYWQANPVIKKQLVVPVTVPNHIYRVTRQMNDCRLKAVGKFKLVLIAFCFLLQVGEYTHHGNGVRWMQQFQLCDMKFFIHEHWIMPEQLAQYWEQINLVCLTIDNQKNRNKGQNLSHHALTGDNQCCTVKALVSRAQDMVQNGASQEMLICVFKEVPSLPWQHVWSTNIVKVVKDAIPAVDLEIHALKSWKWACTHYKLEEQWCCTWTTIQCWISKGQDVGQAQHSWNTFTASCLQWWED